MTKKGDPIRISRKEKFALRQKRNAKVIERAKRSATGDGSRKEATTRVLPAPITIGNADPSRLFDVYLPNPAARDTDGRRELRSLVSRLQFACGVAALVAHTQLMAKYRDDHDRHDRAVTLIEKHAGLTHDYLMRFGNEELARHHAEMEDDFVLLTRILFDPSQAAGPLALGRQADMQLEALALISKGLDRAHRIIHAVDEAAGLRRDVGAWEKLDDAYRHGPEKGTITRLDLVRMAGLADVNPVALWVQHAQFMAPVLEVARFGARLVLSRRVGGQTRLDKSLFAPALQVLGVPDVWPDNTDAHAAFTLVRRLVASTCNLDQLTDLIALQRRFDLDLIVGEPRR
jgi:hypothetical protein